MEQIMGQTSSKAVRKSNGIVITLDALGTLYKFKEPVAVQYLDVARRAGITQSLEVDQLQQAFKGAYRDQVTKYPNYGHGTLSGPSEWWAVLVKNTFSQLVKDVPDHLPRQLYDHFSSADAYELHSDVQPFLQSIHNLRAQFSDPRGPSILTGIVTNSDPRVSQVLTALSIKVGDVHEPTREEVRQTATAAVESGQIQTPWSNAYDLKNDFDFIVTGYEAGVEKPEAKIWQFADFKASLANISKSQKGIDLSDGKFSSIFAIATNAIRNVGQTEDMQWIHIGDEYEKDYLGATSVGKQALLLDREGSMDVQADKIGNLEDAATVVNLMAQETLRQGGE